MKFMDREQLKEEVAHLNTNNKPIVWLQKWSIGTARSDNKDGGGNRNGTSWRLIGYAPEHHRLTMMMGADHYIETSRLLMFSSLTKTAETRNTFYILEDIDPQWEKVLANNSLTLAGYDFDRRETHEIDPQVPARAPNS